jgi:hypothetical protein
MAYRLGLRVRPWLVFLVVLLLAYAAYWYVYGRERDLFASTELETLDKDFARYLWASDADDNESKRLSELFARRSESLSSALNGSLTLAPNGTGGSTLNGSFLLNKQNWITNRVYVHIRILEKRRCGENSTTCSLTPNGIKNALPIQPIQLWMLWMDRGTSVS